MKYKNNLILTNPRRVPFSLSNQFDDTFGLTDMVSDCKNAEDFCVAANKYDRFHLKWKIDKDSKNETRNLRNLRKRTVEIRNCILEEMQWNILSQIHLIMMMTYILGIR